MITNEPLTLIYSYEECDNTLSGIDVSSQLIWTRTTTDNGGRPKFIGNIYLDLFSLQKVNVVDIRKNSFILETDNNNFLVRNIVSCNNSISFEMTGGNNRPVSFNIKDLLNDYSDITSRMYEGQSLVAAKFPWALVFAAACLITTAVDYYCDREIESDVAACTADGKCSVVQTCGAECITCPEPE